MEEKEVNKFKEYIDKCEMYKENISKQLKEYRHKNNLTQEDLADKLGYHQKSVAKWEQCVALPPIEQILQLKEIIGISIDEFLGFKKKSIIDNMIDVEFDVRKYISKEKIGESLFKDIIKPIVLDYAKNKIDLTEGSLNLEIAKTIRAKYFDGDIRYMKEIGGHLFAYADRYYVSVNLLKEMFDICVKVLQLNLIEPEKHGIDSLKIKELENDLKTILEYKNIYKDLL